MEKLTHTEVVTLLIQIGIMLFSAKFLGEISRRLKQPPVIGEILAGILLGPTMFGAISPEMFDVIFPRTGNTSIVLNGLISISVILLIFIAGLEVELGVVLRESKKAFFISALGILLPFGTGFLFAYYYPEVFNLADLKSRIIFALFMGTAMSITALPVLARILIDLNLFKTKIGAPIIASAMLTDLIGWLIFTVIISMQINTDNNQMSLLSTLFLTIGFTLFMLTAGKKLLDKLLTWVNKNLAWPGGFLSVTIIICFFCAAFTEYIGIHAVFGAFIVGVVISSTSNLSERAKEIIHQFVNNIFAPLFFVSIGLHVDMLHDFNLNLTLIILCLAFSGKVLGCGLGAYLSGCSIRESLAVGFGMNARGAMEIILGLLALEIGLISEEIFVALVAMAMITSLTSGPLMKLFMKHNN